MPQTDPSQYRSAAIPRGSSEGTLGGGQGLPVGLAVVVPVLGHATWHLYRRAVAG